MPIKNYILNVKSHLCKIISQISLFLLAMLYKQALQHTHDREMHCGAVYVVASLRDRDTYIGSTDHWRFAPGGRPYTHIRMLMGHRAGLCGSCATPWYHQASTLFTVTWNIMPLYIYPDCTVSSLRHTRKYTYALYILRLHTAQH